MHVTSRQNHLEGGARFPSESKGLMPNGGIIRWHSTQKGGYHEQTPSLKSYVKNLTAVRNKLVLLPATKISRLFFHHNIT